MISPADVDGWPQDLAVRPFSGIDRTATLEEVERAWSQRCEERNFGPASFCGHLDARPARISYHNYPLLGRNLPLKALINTRVAEEWYGNATSYCEVMEFHNAGFEIVGSGDVVLDCGAHHGIYSMVFADAAGPEGRVVAFEPVPINAELARLNIDMNGFDNIDVVAAGIGKNDDVIRASMQAHSTALNTAELPDSTEMQIVPLDKFVPLRPDFVKLDIEGAEVDALRGARELLKLRPKLLISVHPPLMGPFGCHPQEVLGLISSSEYRGYYLQSGNPIRPIDSDIDFDDFFELLFVPA